MHNFHPRIARLGKRAVLVDFVADVWTREREISALARMINICVPNTFYGKYFLIPGVSEIYNALPPHVVVQIRRIDFERGRGKKFVKS